MSQMLSSPRAILIAGPTASGKSALALRKAASHDGVIINADSMQVYGDLQVLSARPSDEETSQAPHLLYGHVDGAVAYSVARWLADATAAIADAERNGRTPIVVGGTGLYFKALLEGLSPVPEIPDVIREKWRRVAEDGGPELHRRLSELDPLAAADLRPSDRQRLTRALEVFDATGRSIRAWQEIKGTPSLQAQDCERIVLAPEREALYARCDARFETMLEMGALDEVADLMARDLPDGMPVLGALGVGPLAELLAGRLSRDEAIAQSQMETRRYAKRQLTWGRNQMADWTRITEMN